MARTKKPPTNVRWNAGRKTYELVKRDRRLRGGRVSLSLSTSDLEEASTRRQDFLTLLEAGRRGVIEALRAGTVHWSDVRRAIRDGDYTELQTSLVPVPTLGEAKAMLLKDVRGKKHLRASTAAVYDRFLTHIVNDFGGATPLDALSTDQVRDWLRAPKWGRPGRNKTPKVWSANTQVMARTVGKRLYDFQIERLAEQAERQKTVPPIRKNPFDGTEARRESGTRVEFLRPEEWQKVSAAAEGLPEHAVVALGTLAGLRLGEIANLRTDLDIDWEKRVLRIQPRPGQYEWKPKTARSVRTVPISPELYRILSHHRAKFAGTLYFIVSAERDRPLVQETLRSWVRRVLEAAGIRYGQKADALTAHSLRHTFASWAVQADVQLLKVAKVMGDRPEEVARTYAHLLPDDLDAVTDAVDKAARKSAKRTAEDAD